MRRQAISLKAFVGLVGCLGVHLFRRHANGASYMLEDGRIASELFNGTTWEWYITEV
jgi:hypothetical protein